MRYQHGVLLIAQRPTEIGTSLSCYSAVGDMWGTTEWTLLACMDAQVHEEPRKALCKGSHLMVTDQEGFGNALINSTFILL